MERTDKGYSFNRRIVTVDDHPRIYVVPASEMNKVSEKTSLNTGKKGKEAAVSFFGRHLGKLIAEGIAETPELHSIDTELDSSLEIVRKKLQRTPAAQAVEGKRISQEEMKHRRFIEERNRAQEALFEDILRAHREFGTGIELEALWSLHGLMKKEADHEATCALQEPFHEHIECNVLGFLRSKAAEQAWQQLEDYMMRFHIPFPIPPSMMDPKEPVRNERVKEERKRSARDEFLKMAAHQLAELSLGNVPAWVYSYPTKESYLWQLTVLQGVAAGMAANALIQYLALWEENSSEILGKISHDCMDKIIGIRKRGESATNPSEVFSVSMELQRISREEIPSLIWKYISSKMKAP